jgi:hypothetical protein
VVPSGLPDSALRVMQYEAEMGGTGAQLAPAISRTPPLAVNKRAQPARCVMLSPGSDWVTAGEGFGHRGELGVLAAHALPELRLLLRRRHLAGADPLA